MAANLFSIARLWFVGLAVLVFSALLPANHILWAAPLSQSQATATVVIAALNLRAGPGVDFPRIGG